MSIVSIKSDVNIAVDVFRGHEPPRKGYVEYRIVSLVRLESSCRRIVVWRRYNRIVFPPKSLTGKYDPEQLESRRRNLHLFMNECVATLPGVGRISDFASFLRGEQHPYPIYDVRSARVTLTPRYHSLWHLRRGRGNFGVSHVASSLKQMKIPSELLEMDLHVRIVSICGDITSLASLLLNVTVFPDFSSRKLVSSPLCAGVSAVVPGVTDFSSNARNRGSSRWCVSSIQDKRYEMTKFTKHRSEMIVQLWESESMEGESDAIKLDELPVRVVVTTSPKKDSLNRICLKSSKKESSEWSVEIETWLQLSTRAMKTYSRIFPKHGSSCFPRSDQYVRHITSMLLKESAENALRSDSSRLDLVHSSCPSRFTDGMMRVKCSSSSNSTAACTVLDEASRTEWSASAAKSQWLCLSWKRAHHLTSVHILWSKPPTTFRVETSSDGNSWQIFGVSTQTVESSCLYGGWTIVDGVSKSPALLVRHVRIILLTKGRFGDYSVICVRPIGMPSSSKRNRWLARQASECQRIASRAASMIARGQTGALYGRRVVLSSRDDDIFNEQEISPIHTEMRRCLETSSSLDRCWPRFVLEWDWMSAHERATLVRGICAISWRSAERTIMFNQSRKKEEEEDDDDEDTFCPMLRIITTSACFALRILANVNTVAIRGYVRVKRSINIPRPDVVLSFFCVIHAWLLPLLEDVATGLSGACGLQNVEMAGTKAHRDLVQLCTDYISVLRTLRWMTTILGELKGDENDTKDNNLVLFEDEDKQRRLRVLFGDLDRLGTGYVDRTICRGVLNTLGGGEGNRQRRITNKTLSKLLQRADGDGDGRVNYEDFESSLMRDNTTTTTTADEEEDPMQIFRVSTHDVQRVQRRLIAAYAKDAESKAVRAVTKLVRSLMLSADDNEDESSSTSFKYEKALRDVEDKILHESKNGSNYELATSLVRGYARAAMEFARVVRSIMSTKRCTQQALLRTANCSFFLHSRFVKLTKRVRSSYSAIEKGKEEESDNTKNSLTRRSGFVRAGNFVLSHFISTAFVKTGLIGEKGLFTSTGGRESLFSLPLSDSSVLVGPLTALGAFLSALKPPTLEPKAYARLLTSAARLLCASYIRALRQLRNEDRPIGHGYEFSSSDISKDSEKFDVCSSLGPLVQDLQSKLNDVAFKTKDRKISRQLFMMLTKNLSCLRLCSLHDIEKSIEPFVSTNTDNVDHVAWCRWLRRHHTVSLGGSVSRRTIREDQQKIMQLFAVVILHLDTHASEGKSGDAFDSYALARTIAHELNPLQVLITMLTCPLPSIVGGISSSSSERETVRLRKSKRFRMSQRLVGSMLCSGNVYKRSKWMHQWRKRYCIVRVNRGQEYQIAFFRSVEDADLAMAGKKISTSRVYVLPAGTAVEMQSTVLPIGALEEDEKDVEWYGLSLKLPTQEMFLAFTSQSEQEKWFEAVQKASSNAIAHVVAAVTLSSSSQDLSSSTKKENKEEERHATSAAPVLDELCLGLALLRPKPKPLAILKAIRLCLKLRGGLSKTLRVSIEKTCRQRLQDGLGAHSLIVANRHEEEENEEEEEDEEEEEEKETSSASSNSIDMEQSVYDWIYFVPLTSGAAATTTKNTTTKSETKVSTPSTPIIASHKLFLTAILWKRSDFWKTWKRRVVVFRSGIGKHDEISYWRKSSYEGNLEEAVRGDVLGTPDGTYIIKGYRALPVEERPEKNRPSGVADVFPFEIAIMEKNDSSKKKVEISTMRLATDSMPQRAEWATAIQQATIFRRTNSVVSVKDLVSKKIDNNDENDNGYSDKSSGDEDLEDVNVTVKTPLHEIKSENDGKNRLEMYDIARFYEHMFGFIQENMLMNITSTDMDATTTIMSQALNFLDALGGPDSSSGKEFLRFFANENIRPYKLRFHVDDRGHVKISEAGLTKLSERFDWFQKLLTKFDECLETKWSVPIIWHHAMLEDMCKVFCLVTRTHLFNLLEDDSDLATVIQALKTTSRFEQKLVRELHRRQVLGADISKRIENKRSGQNEENVEREDDLRRDVISGVLLKQSKWLLQWRRRSFVLRGRRLTVYHECEKEIRDLLESEPDDVFALRPGTVSVVADDTTQCVLEDKSQWFVMRLKIARAEMILAASTERERSKWIKSFRKVSAWKKNKQLREASSGSSSNKNVRRTTLSQKKKKNDDDDYDVDDDGDDEKSRTHRISEFDPQNMITSVFEPHIVRFVRVEEEALHKILLEITTSSSSRQEKFVDLNVHKAILASALDLTGNGFKRVLTHCSAVANGRVFWRLHRCFKDCLTKYGNYLLFVKLISSGGGGGGGGGGGNSTNELQRMSSTPRVASSSRFSPSSSIPLDTKTRHITCCVANTAAYLIMTIPGLEDAFRDHMEDAYADHVDMSSEMEHLYGIVNHAVRRVKDDVLRQLRPVMMRFRESNSKARRSLFVSSNTASNTNVTYSPEVSNVAKMLLSMCPTIQDELSPPNYKRFCEILATSLMREYVRAVLHMSSSPSLEYTRMSPIKIEAVEHMKQDLEDLIDVMKRLPKSKYTSLSSPGDVKDISSDTFDEKKLKRMYASFFNVLKMTRSNVMRIFAVLDVKISLDNFRDAVASVWKDVMPSALPGSVTPSLLPADELQCALRLKGASEEESMVIMAELGLQYNKRLLKRSASARLSMFQSPWGGSTPPS